MAHTTATDLLVISILVFAVIEPAASSCHWSKGYTVSINDGLQGDPKELTFHCFSKPDDLGLHTLYEWQFCDNLWKRTLWACHFWWGSKQQAFEVYTHKLGKNECGSGTCYWKVIADGFYLSDGTMGQPVKKYDWA